MYTPANTFSEGTRDSTLDRKYSKIRRGPCNNRYLRAAEGNFTPFGGVLNPSRRVHSLVPDHGLYATKLRGVVGLLYATAAIAARSRFVLISTFPTREPDKLTSASGTRFVPEHVFYSNKLLIQPPLSNNGGSLGQVRCTRINLWNYRPSIRSSV